MKITLGSNIAAMRGTRQLRKTSVELGAIYERLSSGQRINKASDDAAGLALASALNADNRVFNQGVRNLNDGLSLLSIAEGALKTLSDITIRISELAEQAANGVYEYEQRHALDDEAAALIAEANRVIAATEFNGTNLLDGSMREVVLQAGYSQLTVEVGLPNSVQAIGTGTFSLAVSLAAATNPVLVDVDDLNGDGFSDIVHGGNDEIYVHLNDGSNNFSTSQVNAIGIGAPGPTIVDIDQDGDNDIVALSADFVSVFFNDGAGNFSGQIDFAHQGSAPASSRDLRLADFNNDGKLDAALRNPNDEVVSVLLGNGDGTFQAFTTYATGQNPGQLYLLDFDGDGQQDLAMPGGFTGEFFVLRGLGNGQFSSPVTSTAGSTASDLRTGDFDLDGLDDIFVTDSGGEIYLSNGDGTFRTGQDLVIGVFDPLVGDINRDGFLDLIGQNDVILFGNGDGTFASGQPTGTDFNELRRGRLKDFNGDGVPDIADASGGAPRSVSIFLADTVTGSAPVTFEDVSLLTQASARAALDKMRQLRSSVVEGIARIGVGQSKIHTAINNLQAAAEAFKSAESRIVDVDVAEESSRLVRANILQQAASAILAQANQQPALSLALLS